MENKKYHIAISALRAIIDPIEHMKSQLKEDERLDGMWAIKVAERPEFYQDIAKKALAEIENIEKIEILYQKYTRAYEIEIRETYSYLSRKLLGEINLLEDLSFEEFKERLNDKTFKEKWGSI